MITAFLVACIRFLIVDLFVLPVEKHGNFMEAITLLTCSFSQVSICIGWNKPSLCIRVVEICVVCIYDILHKILLFLISSTQLLFG